MIREIFAGIFLVLAGLFLGLTLFLALSADSLRVFPEPPAVRDPQPVRADRSFLVLNARSLKGRNMGGVHCAGDLGRPAVKPRVA